MNVWPELDMISVGASDSAETEPPDLEVYSLTGVEIDRTDPPGPRRLVCATGDGGSLVIRGDDGQRRNIEAVLRTAARSGWPIVVRCRTRGPGQTQAQRFSRTRLVRQDAPFQIVSPQR